MDNITFDIWMWIKENAGMGYAFAAFVLVIVVVNFGKIANIIKLIKGKIPVKPERQKWAVCRNAAICNIATQIMKHEPLLPIFTSTKGLILVQSSIRAVTNEASYTDCALTESDAPLPIYLIRKEGCIYIGKKLQHEYGEKLMKIASRSAGVQQP